MRISGDHLIKDCPGCGAEMVHGLDCESEKNLYYIPKTKGHLLLKVTQRGFPQGLKVEEKKKRGRPRKLPKVICYVKVNDIIRALAKGKYFTRKKPDKEGA